MLICKYKGIRKDFWQSEPTLPRNTWMTACVLFEPQEPHRFRKAGFTSGNAHTDLGGAWKARHSIGNCGAGAGKQGGVAGAGHFDDASLHVSLPLNDRSAFLSAFLYQGETLSCPAPCRPRWRPLSIDGGPCMGRKGRVVHPKNMREGKTQGARRKRQGPGAKALAFATEKSRRRGGKYLCYKLTL